MASLGALDLEKRNQSGMIKIDEIRTHASRVSLANTVVEKDYALGWLLWGIHKHIIAGRDWIFKGGTCLKKCYFETYRFSEDLDFTYRGTEQLSVDSLVKIMTEVADFIWQEAGIEIPKASIEFEIFKNPRGSLSIQGGVKFRGPVRPQVGLQQMQRIKIDLTLDEPLVLNPVVKKVDHPYSDLPTDGIAVLSYDYEEVFAEKIRALAQRLRPRDLYDVIHLHRRQDLRPNQSLVLSTLEKKCTLRGIDIPTFASLESHDNRTFLESEWETQLKHQIPVLPSFQSFLSELPDVFLWLSGGEGSELEALEPSADQEQVTTTVQESYAKLVSVGGTLSTNMDRIRFAAANRLLISLEYNGSVRLIEAYSLARSSDGNLLLYAIKHETGEARSYRFDRMQSLKITDQSFTPKYLIEITSAGYLPIHQLTRNNPPKASTQRRNPSALTYVYRCSVCGKQSRKKKMDSNIGPHKNKSGYPCAGRTGIYLKTSY